MSIFLGRNPQLIKGSSDLSNTSVTAVGDGASRGAYLQGQVPRDVHVGLVVVHPDLGHPQSVPLGVKADVAVVRFLLPLDVGHPGARQDLHAAAAEPHLEAQGFHNQPDREIPEATAPPRGPKATAQETA